jgi:hypothetical protein
MKAIMRGAFLERTGMENVSCSSPKIISKNILDTIGQMVIPSSSLPKVYRE